MPAVTALVVAVQPRPRVTFGDAGCLCWVLVARILAAPTDSLGDHPNHLAGRRADFILGRAAAADRLAVPFTVVDVATHQAGLVTRPGHQTDIEATLDVAVDDHDLAVRPKSTFTRTLNAADTLKNGRHGLPVQP